MVHKARWHGTIVAVKILKDTGAVAIGDFKTELNVLLKVHHTHTVSKQAYSAMYAAGMTTYAFFRP